MTIDENVRKRIGDTDACIFFNREKGTFDPINIKIYANNPPKINTKWNKLAYATVFAHEFTHYMQIKSKENKEFMINLSDNNFDYLRMLMPIGDGIFDEFDGMKFRFTGKVFNFIDKISEKIYSFPLARKKSFKREDILTSGGLKNDEEFNRYISDKFNKIFSRTLSIILFEEDSADESIVDFIKENIQNKEKLLKLKKDLKIYCSAKAKYEFEAYKTESELAKRVLKTNKRLNIDSYIMYYSMLENALK